MRFFCLFLFTLTFTASALNCTDGQWEKCNNDMNCLVKESGSCGEYIKRLLACKPCQVYDNEHDTLMCFIIHDC